MPVGNKLFLLNAHSRLELLESRGILNTNKKTPLYEMIQSRIYEVSVKERAEVIEATSEIETKQLQENIPPVPQTESTYHQVLEIDLSVQLEAKSNSSSMKSIVKHICQRICSPLQSLIDFVSPNIAKQSGYQHYQYFFFPQRLLITFFVR